MQPAFLSLDEVLEMQQQQIQICVGSPGLQDAAALESSIAAAYPFHLCQSHAFINGNKRVGANAAVVFLILNGWGAKVRSGLI